MNYLTKPLTLWLLRQPPSCVDILCPDLTARRREHLLWGLERTVAPVLTVLISFFLSHTAVLRRAIVVVTCQLANEVASVNPSFFGQPHNNTPVLFDRALFRRNSKLLSSVIVELFCGILPNFGNFSSFREKYKKDLIVADAFTPRFTMRPRQRAFNRY